MADMDGCYSLMTHTTDTGLSIRVFVFEYVSLVTRWVHMVLNCQMEPQTCVRCQLDFVKSLDLHVLKM